MSTFSTTVLRKGQKAFLISNLFLIQACSTSPLLSSDFPPPGPPNFEKGMMDGCKSAASAIGAGTVLGAFYHEIKYDVGQSLNDKIYARAWEDGFRYCKYSLDSGLVT